MKFGLLITEGPYQHEASDSAYQFAKAALAKGHEILRIFFYSDGVLNSTKLMDPQADDRHIQKQWTELSTSNNIDVIVCVAAAKRRGINDDVIADGFKIGGLGMLTELAIEADRLVEFRA
ncbi:MAG: sulfurtransferase complex subunit TusD [Thermoleophilia bacterium]|nr:sulfurtransferase complex subunit TusD [Thermoleophilia bacterium]